jgi:hypothetical protein
MVHKERRWWLNIKVEERPFAEGSSDYKFYNLQNLWYLPALSSHCSHHKHLEWLKLMREQLWCICFFFAGKRKVHYSEKELQSTLKVSHISEGVSPSHTIVLPCTLPNLASSWLTMFASRFIQTSLVSLSLSNSLMILIRNANGEVFGVQLWCICLTNHKLKTSCPVNSSTQTSCYST